MKPKLFSQILFFPSQYIFPTENIFAQSMLCRVLCEDVKQFWAIFPGPLDLAERTCCGCHLPGTRKWDLSAMMLALQNILPLDITSALFLSLFQKSFKIWLCHQGWGSHRTGILFRWLYYWDGCTHILSAWGLHIL